MPNLVGGLSSIGRLSVEALSRFLQDKGFESEITDSLKGNNVDGATFVKFTRDDLKDIFPLYFLRRKKVWDFLEDIRSEDIKQVVRIDDEGSGDDENVGLNESFQFELTQHASPTTRPFTSSPPPLSPPTSTEFKPSLSGRSTPESVASGTQSSSSRKSRTPQSSASGSSKKGENSGSSGTESVVDIEEDFKFPVSREMRKCDSEDKYPEDNVLRRFIRDCAACLQAVAGDDISPTNLVLAATKMCDTVNVLKDQKPASFPSNRQFPYWSTVLYLLKTRLRNIKGYEKRKLAPPKSEKDVCSSDLGEKEVEELHAELLREVMRKKRNLAAIKELQENTFHSRRCSIQELKAPEKNIVDEIVAKFPFFKEHDCVLLNELELHCKFKDHHGHCTTVEHFKSNWMEISKKVKITLQTLSLLPDDQEVSPDDICGALLEHAHTIVDEKSCGIPLMNNFPQSKSPVDTIVQKGTKTTQPTLWFSMDEGLPHQLFIAIDKVIFIELSKPSHLHGILVLLAVYFAFDLCYDKRQEIIFRFFEEFVLGIRPAKKSARYSKLCKRLMPEISEQ